MVIPQGFVLRIDPDGIGVHIQHALQPSRTRFLVGVLDTAAGEGDFIRAHGGVADENHFVVVGKGAQHVVREYALGVAPPVVLPHAFV